MNNLIDRPTYLQRALSFKDTDLVKVVTGLRRCGKSSLLALVRQGFEAEGLPASSFVDLNLEDIGLGIHTGDDLYAYCKAKLNPNGKTYIFLDEIQRVKGWHDAVNAMRAAFDCDLYVTGSNVFLLSSELATYLSGRYVEVRMLPLAFEEYVHFCGVSLNGAHTAGLTASGEVITCDDLLLRYLTYGGMPAIASLATAQGMHAAYMAGLYDTVVVRDILDRERHASAAEAGAQGSGEADAIRDGRARVRHHAHRPRQDRLRTACGRAPAAARHVRGGGARDARAKPGGRRQAHPLHRLVPRLAPGCGRGCLLRDVWQTAQTITDEQVRGQVDTCYTCERPGEHGGIVPPE